MQKKQLELLIALGLLFILTSGTSYFFCEKDIVLEYINRIGNWSNAILLKSTYVFVAYTLANSAYNIDYVLPKVAHSLFVIKYFDKVNGWLGFSSKGELEAYLEVAKQSYSPLYKDFILGTYNNIGLPLYNSILAPFITKPEHKPISEKVIEPHYYERLKYAPILSENQHNKLLVQLQTIEKINTQFYQKILSVYDKSAVLFNDVLKLTNQPLQNIDFLSPFFSLDYYEKKLSLSEDILSVDSQGNERIVHSFLHEIDSAYPQTFEIRSIQMQNYDIDDVGFENTIDNWYISVTGFATVPQTNFALSYAPMIVYECSFDIPVPEVYYLTENSPYFILFLKENADKSYQIINKNDSIFIDPYRGDISNAYSDTMSHLKEQVAQVHVETLGLTKQLSSIIAATVGLVGVVTHQLDNIATINVLNDIIVNSEIGKDLANVFLSHSQPVPEFLRQYVSLSNPQDYLLPGETLAETKLPTEINDVPKPNGSILPYIGAGVAILGAIGLTWYLTKYGMDANPVVETAKTFKETLQDKYTNFK